MSSTPQPAVPAVSVPTESQIPDIDVLASIGFSWRELRRGAVADRLRDKLFGEGESALDPGQVDTLDLLVERESWRMGDLAEALRVDPSTATRAIQRLEKLHLAQRSALPSDGRVVTVSATAAGRERHAIISERRLKALSQILSRFSVSELESLESLLGRFVGAIDEVAVTFEP
jgi:DNA-binding MarR family transcriptional regulator